MAFALLWYKVTIFFSNNKTRAPTRTSRAGVEHHNNHRVKRTSITPACYQTCYPKHDDGTDYGADQCSKPRSSLKSEQAEKPAAQYGPDYAEDEVYQAAAALPFLNPACKITCKNTCQNAYSENFHNA